LDALAAWLPFQLRKQIVIYQKKITAWRSALTDDMAGSFFADVECLHVERNR
jgi:hypothetical protein